MDSSEKDIVVGLKMLRTESGRESPANPEMELGAQAERYVGCASIQCIHRDR